jgi:hypothetical protein
MVKYQQKWKREQTYSMELALGQQVEVACQLVLATELAWLQQIRLGIVQQPNEDEEEV